MAINLFLNYYKSDDAKREYEYLSTLIANIENTMIDDIYVFMDKDYLGIINVKKLHRIVTKTRPTFTNIFRFVNLISRELDINIVANADILFDHTLWQTSKMRFKDCFALSRYENDVVVPYAKLSQDVWMFKGKIKTDLIANFHMGVRGCDNRLAYEIQKSGYLVTNPCLDIRCTHVHETNLRTYDQKKGIPGPYLILEPIKIKDINNE
jgi:hypothetical protein